jgi:hypothetical protein
MGLVSFAGCGGGGSTSPQSSQGSGKAGAELQLPLTGSDVVSLELSDKNLYAPTRVTRVARCDIAQEPTGALACNITGSQESGGQYAGVRFRTGPLKELQLDIAVMHSQVVNSLQVDLYDMKTKRQRLERWVVSRPKEGVKTYVFRPGQALGNFGHTVLATGTPDTVDVLMKLRPVKAGGPPASAGFVVNQVRYRQLEKAEAKRDTE